MSEEEKLGGWVMPRDVEHFRACMKEAMELGKKQGRADAMKELMEGSPDGWAIFDNDRNGNFSGDFYQDIHSAITDFQDAINYLIVPVKLLKMEPDKLDKGVESED